MQNILNYQANPTPENAQIYGFVYKIANNVNNKVYIGQTTQKVSNRFQQHKAYAWKGDTYLANAIRKHGEEAFSIKTIRECSDQEELNYYEGKYIELYDSVKTGYNLDNIIIAGGKRSEEAKKRLQKIRDDNPRRPFNVYDLTGKFIGLFKSQREAEKQLKIGLNQANLCLNGAMNRSGNYVFIDLNEDTEENRTLTIQIALNTYQDHSVKAIKVFKKDGTFVGEFENANIAAKELDLDPSTVSKVALEKLRYTKDYLIIFSKDFSKTLLQRRLKALKSSLKRRILKTGGLIHCNNGKIYNSREEIIDDLGISQSQICRLLHNDMLNSDIKLWMVYE